MPGELDNLQELNFYIKTGQKLKNTFFKIRQIFIGNYFFVKTRQI